MGSLSFIGTATTLLRLGTFTLLTDPNFLHRGQRAYLGKGLWSRRLTEPSMQPNELPPLDVVVLSHLHGDHFDRVARRGLARTQPIITTPSAQRQLSKWGFVAEGLATWETFDLKRGQESLTIQSLPAVHARGLLGKLLPPVMGSLVEHRVANEVRQRIYLSGDTLNGQHLDEIKRRTPHIDTAVVHLGGTRVLFSTVTMDAEQGTDFLRRIEPREVVPVHFDDYRVFRSSLEDFTERAVAAGFGGRLRSVSRGETIELRESPPAG